MNRRILIVSSLAVGVWALLNLLVGLWVLPPMLLAAGLPSRTETQRAHIREVLQPPGAAWTATTVPGGESRPLQVWRLRRPGSRGVAVLLHGFGDDAWGTAPRLRDLPDWDAVVFTFRGRDLDPSVPSTLGGWETADVVAVVRALEAEGTPRKDILLVGASQGAGVALLALARLEAEGGPLAGALLESPFRNLKDAGRNHLRGTLGNGEWLLRPAERIAFLRAGRIARFHPGDVSPEDASRNLRTPVALLTGDADGITPLAGVRAIARNLPDLTVVPGAGHLEAGERVPGGWAAWAADRLKRFGRR